MHIWDIRWEKERKMFQYRKVFSHEHDDFIKNGRREAEANIAYTVMQPESMVYP